MADIKKINGYFLKDEAARAEIVKLKNGTEPVGQATNATYAQNAYNYTLSGGNIVGSIKDKFDNVDQTIAAHAEKIAEVQTDVVAAQETANQAKSIAEGRVRAVVFDTVAAMTTALKAAAKTDYKIGDNLLIEETGVPDYWVSGILETNTGTYGYYTIAELETQKVDLSAYPTRQEVSTQITAVDNRVTQANAEIGKILNGQSKVGAAQGADIATNYNTSSGTIKTKFDSIDEDLEFMGGRIDDAKAVGTEALEKANTNAATIEDFKNGITPVSTARAYYDSSTKLNIPLDATVAALKAKDDALAAKTVRFTYSESDESLTISFS